jgi:drug/metabolite transporter (DMT)-like permease
LKGVVSVKLLKTFLAKREADLSMTIIVVIWGFHFIVMKDALTHFAPLTFNALRFTLALPIIVWLAARRPSALHMTWPDFRTLLVWSLIGPVLAQVFFVLALQWTTATNTALLLATMPAWTALFSIWMGLIVARRGLLFGVGLTLVGVVLVVLSRAESGLAFSSRDLLASAMLLATAVTSALFNIESKPIVDRYGGRAVAIWTFGFTWAGLMILAAPDLVKLSASDLPSKVWPSFLYSGLLSSLGGYLTWNHALRILGPTRAATYNNLTPLVAALAGIVILGEPLTVALLFGAAFTLFGVGVIRVNTQATAPGVSFKKSKAPVVAPVSTGD